MTSANVDQADELPRKHDPEAFERFLTHARRTRSDMADAWIKVADTAEGAEKWFKSRQLSFTAADLVAITRVVLERRDTEAETRKREDAFEARDDLNEAVLTELRALGERVANLAQEIRTLRK